MQTPSIGRIVHYVLGPNARRPGQVRPAIVTKVWSDTCVNLRVFGEANDFESLDFEALTSVLMGDGAAHGTWSWPPFVPAQGGK